MIDQSHLRQSSPFTAVPKVADCPDRAEDRMSMAGRRDHLVLLTSVALTSVVAINTWSLFQPPREVGIYVPLPDTVPLLDTRAASSDVESAGDGGEDGPVGLSSSVLAERVQPTARTPGPLTAAATKPRTAAYPNLMSALSRVPPKVKLHALLTLLESEADPEKLAALQTKLWALLKLPEHVLVRVLQHPDLADFNAMLDAVFVGETELWWIEIQLDKIAVVPVTETSDRIDVSGKPAYEYHSSAVAHKGDGGPSTSSLKSLTPSSAQQASLMKMAQPDEDAGVTTFTALPTPNDIQMRQFSMSAPMVDAVPAAAPSSAPAPSLAPSPAPVASVKPAPTNADVSRDPIGSQPTSSPDVFDTGNRFEPGTKVTDPTTSDTPAIETSTASISSPAAESGANVTTPSADPNEGASSAAPASP